MRGADAMPPAADALEHYDVHIMSEPANVGYA